MPRLPGGTGAHPVDSHMSRRFESQRFPSWRHYGAPTAAYRLMWRRKCRAKIKTQCARAILGQEVSIETRITRLTSIYDWY